jgi:hypothetical protein
MSIENISISIDPSPIRNLIKTVVREETQPTLYGSDNTVAQVVREEVENNPQISDILTQKFTDFMDTRTFENMINGIVDVTEVAEALDMSDLAGYISIRRLAAEINSSDIASEMSTSDIASELSISDIANEIDLENLADTIVSEHLISVSDELANKINYKLLARELIIALTEKQIRSTPNA